MPVKNREATNDEDTEKPRVFFRSVPVFDRTQVETIEGADPAPLEPPCARLTGDSHRHLLEPLQAFAVSLGYSVSFEPIPGSTGGWCDHDGKRIAVDATQPFNAQVRILVHELAHALGVGYREYGRHQAEVIVDTTTFSCAQTVGLDTSANSIPYLTSWAERASLEVLEQAAALTGRLADRIEGVLLADPAGLQPGNQQVVDAPQAIAV